MSDFPVTLGDLADVDQALRAMIEELQRRTRSDAEVTDEKFAALRATVLKQDGWIELASGAITRLEGRVNELERLWAVALENPELVRELAVQALKGKSVL